MNTLGCRLQGYRLANGWSKRIVAAKLAVSTPSIMRWEKGLAEPNDYNRYKIEQLLAGSVASIDTDPTVEAAALEQLSLFSDHGARPDPRP